MYKTMKTTNEGIKLQVLIKFFVRVQLLATQQYLYPIYF